MSEQSEYERGFFAGSAVVPRWEEHVRNLETELAALRREHETWRDWQKLVETERANTAEAVKQRDEAQAELATAIAVRDDNEAVAVERLARLVLVEADAKALADRIRMMCGGCHKGMPLANLYFDGDRWHEDGEQRQRCMLSIGTRAALAAHEALKLPRNGLVVIE